MTKTPESPRKITITPETFVALGEKFQLILSRNKKEEVAAQIAAGELQIVAWALMQLQENGQPIIDAQLLLKIYDEIAEVIPATAHVALSKTQKRSTLLPDNQKSITVGPGYYPGQETEEGHILRGES